MRRNLAALRNEKESGSFKEWGGIKASVSVSFLHLMYCSP